MIVGFPALGTRWSDFAVAGAASQARMAMIGSDGCLYHVLSDDAVPSTRVRRSPSFTNLYTFPAYSGDFLYAGTHLVPTSHGDWIYQGGVGRSGQTIYMGTFAYNPVRGQSATIWLDTVSLSYLPYSVSAFYRWSDVAVDPVTGIGLAYHGYSISYVYVVHHPGGGPVEPWDEYVAIAESGYRLFTFTAGSGATAPVYVTSPLVSSRFTGGPYSSYGLVGAYNNIGLFFHYGMLAYYRIADLASPSVGSAWRTGTTPLSLIKGPNLFRDSASAPTIRDSEGRTWTISGVGSGLVSIYELEVIGSTATEWIINLLVYSGGDSSCVYAVCTLAKAGTTFAVLDTVVTDLSAAYMTAWDSYLIGKSPFLGVSGFPVEGKIPFHDRGNVVKMFALSPREST